MNQWEPREWFLIRVPIFLPKDILRYLINDGFASRYSFTDYAKKLVNEDKTKQKMYLSGFF